jgi:hypothetical protein
LHGREWRGGGILGGGTHTKMEMDEGLGRGIRMRQGLNRDP